MQVVHLHHLRSKHRVSTLTFPLSSIGDISYCKIFGDSSFYIVIINLYFKINNFINAVH
jgi:hypothetical protein